MVSAETACEALHKAFPRKRRGRGTGWLRHTRVGIPVILVRNRTHWIRPDRTTPATCGSPNRSLHGGSGAGPKPP